MARYLNIFVDSMSEPEAFAGELESILGLPLTKVTDNEFIFYEYKDDLRWFDFGFHEQENDRDLRFEDYRYQIQVGSRRIGDWQVYEKVKEDFAREIYEKLKASHKYRLMLTDDVQIKLDEFAPTPQTLK
jgi:hypothetical protein